MVLGLFLQSRKEDDFNLRKWEDEHRQYMKEVPRFNFILGLWRGFKRG